jgi:hypothetical protein
MMIRRPPQPRTRVLGRLGFGGLGAVGISGLGVCCRHVEQAARLGDGVGESELGEAMTINAEGTVRLVLLRHKFKRERRAVKARQHGHRGKRLTRASMMRRRTVAIEFGTWRSGRNGGSAGAVTVGNGKLREPRGGTRS